MFIRSELDGFGETIRSIISIETKEFGTVIMCDIRAIMGESTVFTAYGTLVQRGDNVGVFKFGCSTIIFFQEIIIHRRFVGEF